jgi:NitT/TauT family transport system permease protein
VAQSSVARLWAGLRDGPGKVLRKRRSARVLSLPLFVIVWQSITPLLPTDLIPAPTEVLVFMWDEMRGETLARTHVWQAFAISLQRLGTAFAVALVIGVPVGLAMGVSWWVERMLHDVVMLGLAMPFLVWALLAGLWLGMGGGAPVVTAVLAALPLVIINTLEGVHDVPRELTDMARSFHVSRGHVVRHVVVPSLMPFVFAALRYGLASGWKGLLVAEIFAASSGAGWNIQFWYDARRAQGVFGYALFFILFAVFVERVIFQRLSAWVFRWRPSQLERGAHPATD